MIINRLMVIGATWEQVPLIRAAKNMGCEVIATSSSSNSEGFAYADYSEILDPRDLNAIVKIAEKYSVDAVTSDSCDYSNYAAMFLRNKMGLHNFGMNAVQFTTNKHWMRNKCAEEGVLQPRFEICRSYFEVCKASESIGYPLIIKPSDNRGSFGVTRVAKFSDLQDAFLHALMNAHSREVLVEEYISGIHITVDGCVDSDGKHINLGIASKKITSDEIPIIVEVLYPANNIDDGLMKNIFNINNNVVKALEIKRGLTHSEYIVDSHGGCYLVEMANRGGGVLTSGVIIPAISGVNLSEILVLEALGRPYDVTPWSKSLFAMLDFLIFPTGLVSKIEGVLEASEHPKILHLKMMIKEGDFLGKPSSGAERHGFAIYIGSSYEELESLKKLIRKLIKIEYEN
ncbi:ATP-grasp domain-containing protein [Polynucleobacter alcilacus]|uniref:ATP-grasp domain-containing protein n=1 Tax=Polynucleobacter alcilacus TaxID=1819739 RepID=UPI001C0D0A2B|nr:ATP-grasp domain-containing protein [Polynucleobacter alcilacus]MBU3568175.1 ATP-grasp domain-containing protein [Polynucleobacter alcilacus]